LIKLYFVTEGFLTKKVLDLLTDRKTNINTCGMDCIQKVLWAAQIKNLQEK